MATTLTPPSAPMTDTTSMLSGIGADFFAGASDIPVPASEGVDDTPVDDTPVDAAPADDTPVDTLADGTPGDEPIDAVPTDAAPDTTPAPDATPTDDLEEGVIKTKDAKGKFKYNLDESRYKNFHGAYALAREATDVLGEPLTLDAIKLRNDAYLAQERLYDHITSGEPARQADVVNFLLNEMKTAHADGETGVDPTIPFAETMYSSLREQAPDAYAHVRMQAARDLIGEMFELAASTGDESLGASMGHVARALAGVGPRGQNETPEAYLQRVREITGRSRLPFYTPDEWKGLSRGEEPLSLAQRRIQELESQLNGRSNTGATEQFSNWNRSNSNEVNAAIYEDAVKPVLSSVEEAWKPFKDNYQRLVVDPLNSEVTKAISGDTVLKQQLNDLRAKARRATSEAKRQEIGDTIRQLTVNRARLAVEKAKGPILKSAAQALQGLSAHNNGRRQAGQNRTAPSGTATPVRQSVLPPVTSLKDKLYNSGDAYKQALALVNAGR